MSVICTTAVHPVTPTSPRESHHDLEIRTLLCSCHHRLCKLDIYGNGLLNKCVLRVRSRQRKTSKLSIKPFTHLAGFDGLDGVLGMISRLSGDQDPLNVRVVDQFLRGTVCPTRGCQPFPAE